MILVDSTVVIDYLRTADAKLVSVFRIHDAAICGATRAEVLNGTRSPSHRTQLINALNTFKQLSFPEALWDNLGDNLRALRAAGVTVPFADVIIATVAIENDVELWARDNQFKLIQTVLPRLRLFQEPP